MFPVLKPILIGFFLGFALVGATRLSQDIGRSPLVKASSVEGAAFDRVATRPCSARPGAYISILA